jgi:hypothetical protein
MPLLVVVHGNPDVVKPVKVVEWMQVWRQWLHIFWTLASLELPDGLALRLSGWIVQLHEVAQPDRLAAHVQPLTHLIDAHVQIFELRFLCSKNGTEVAGDKGNVLVQVLQSIYSVSLCGGQAFCRGAISC